MTLPIEVEPPRASELAPRPDDLPREVVWWGCCQSTAGSPEPFLIEDAGIELICCPHCGYAVDEREVHGPEVIQDA